MRSWITQVRKGLVDLCVMAALKNEETYGYQLFQKLSDMEGLEIKQSTVYSILLRLEKEGLIRVTPFASSTTPSRRYYSLTRLGRERLAEMDSYWANISDSIDELLGYKDLK